MGLNRTKIPLNALNKQHKGGETYGKTEITH